MRREALWDRLYLSGIDSRAAELARENGLGLEIAAFCYAPNLEDPAVLSAVRSDMAELDRFWFHAPFAELAPCAIDPLVRQVTEKRYCQAAYMARELGVRRLVIHGGFVPQVYFPEWYVEQSVLFWRDFLRQLPPDMAVALENVMEPQPRLLAEIARQNTGSGIVTEQGFLWPLPGYSNVNSGYGWRWDNSDFHTGLDLGGSGVYGANIVAAKSGVVVSSMTHWSYGNNVVINHGDGYVTLYAHCSQLLVRPGDTVTQGQIIAKVGATGNVTGPHLHFEVYYNGVRQNPAGLIRY